MDLFSYASGKVSGIIGDSPSRCTIGNRVIGEFPGIPAHRGLPGIIPLTCSRSLGPILGIVSKMKQRQTPPKTTRLRPALKQPSTSGPTPASHGHRLPD
jgi:hypothetical protein